MSGEAPRSPLAAQTGQDPKEVERAIRGAIKAQAQQRIEALKARIQARKNAPRTPPLKEMTKAYLVVSHDEQGREGVYAADRIAGHQFSTPTASYFVGERGEVRRVGRVKQTKKQRAAARRAAKTGG